MKILIVGDIHGDFQVLNHLVEVEHPAIIMQVGDFGFWPGDYSNWPPTDPPLRNGATRIHFCDGNHEDHAALAELTAASQLEVAPNCFYQPRGSTLELPDGRTVLFFGGADSVDCHRRQEGVDWFRQEQAQLAELRNIPDMAKIDIIISHSAPMAFQLRKRPPSGYAKGPWLTKHTEPTRAVLNEILSRHHPTHWYFGHFHIHQEGQSSGVNWTALAIPTEGGERWWVELPPK